MDDRDSQRPDHIVSFGPFRLFAAERLLKKDDEPVFLGGRSLDVLITLVERAGEVVTRKELISRVWPDVTVEEAYLRGQITGLRKALGDGRRDARYIVNVPGRGYSFVAPVSHFTTRSSPPSIETTVRLPLANMPARLRRMVGRDDTVHVLSTQLMMSRFVSVIGPGGMGKTTVAVAVAHALLSGFGDAVFFVDLAPISDPQLVPTTVALALGFMWQTQDPLANLLAFVSDKKILLVLDNCEHVIDVAATLAERVVNEAPQAHVIATSREALRAEGEHVYQLRALDCPPEDAALTATDVLLYPAAQLFMEGATAGGYGSELSDNDGQAVARICRRLDGIPLAIELAASRTASHGIAGIEALLQNRFGLLWQGRGTALPRHRTLRAILDWSHDLLDEAERRLLRRLAVFAGGFTLEASAAVMGDPESLPTLADSISNLTAKSLVTWDPASVGRWRLLETIRSYALEKLAESGEVQRIAQRHAEFFLRSPRLNRF
jgi:predicted ATPase/DNA-binding winged helix-turn-helix (wHTH) protein